MIKEGSKAPAFNLVSDTGSKVTSAGLKGQRVVLYFYPKDLTPGCTQEACDFRDASAEFSKRKAVIFGVSRDPMARHQAFVSKYELNFPLLADETGKVCEAYGVWKEKSLYGRKFMGIERSTFIIGDDGRLKKIFRKVKVNGHVREILEALDELNKKTH